MILAMCPVSAVCRRRDARWHSEVIRLAERSPGAQRWGCEPTQRGTQWEEGRGARGYARGR